MKVLVVGGGGREHALAWKLGQSPMVSEVLVAPGNAGTENEPSTRNIPINPKDLEGLVALAKSESVGLTVVGPEQPLVAGITDRFQAAGLKCFGPRAAAAQLEGSKVFTKNFLQRHDIPTASYASFNSLSAALAYVESLEMPIVVKANGLAEGKGVILAQTHMEAEKAVRKMLEDRAFGVAGTTVVIEEYLQGEETSFIAIVDGTQILPLASSQDHKTRDDGDKGPNTGGMGAYSPAPVVTPAIHDRIMQQVMIPTVRGLSSEGLEYRGFLYAGLMIDSEGNPNVLEFNCRFGDPETQPILFRLRSDLTELCLKSFDGTLDTAAVEWDSRAALGVVMASNGYPDNYKKGLKIQGLEPISDDRTKIFQAGTTMKNGQVLTNGGRVLCAVALGNTVSEARIRAYEAVEKIDWEGAIYRRDIGYRAIERERTNAS